MGGHLQRAKDLMTREVICVKKDTSTFEVMELMVKNNIAGVPVVKDDMTLVGIITEKDLLKLFYECERLENNEACDLMTEDVVYFDEGKTLLDICDCLIENDFRRIPVTSNGKVVGIISRPDIIQHILQTKERAKAI